MIRLSDSLRGMAAGLILVLGACGDAGPGERQIKAGQDAIASTDFALRSCGNAGARQSCALLMAGGKRVLLGAPAGVRASFDAVDLKNIDAVLLFSLRGADIDGLGAIRNESWLAGRNAPLRVTGPFGVADVVGAMNTSYEASDAFAYVEQGAPGGFSAAMLESQRGGGEIFNTGDLIITGREDSTGRMSYTVNYNNMVLQVLPCGHDANGKFQPRDGVYVLDCEGGSLQWPLTQTQHIGPVAAHTN
jgi:hypothetical protein